MQTSAVGSTPRSGLDTENAEAGSSNPRRKHEPVIPGLSNMVTRWQEGGSADLYAHTNIQSRTQGPKKRLLCLDGGGIRGISTLLILQKLMEIIKDLSGLENTPPPYKYFDFIGGTSTGGIIAMMLGSLGMTVAQTLKAYKVMAQRAFRPIDSGVLAWVPHLPGRPGGTFSGDSLAEAVKDIIQEYKQDREALFSDKTCCKTVVLAVTKVDVGALPTKFRNYNTGDDLAECKIWEVARATSAAVTFFPAISCGQQGIEFIDAGFGHNNPSEVLISEAEDIFGEDNLGCILSIGTGLNGAIVVENRRLSILTALKKMAVSAEAVHRRLAKSLSEDTYFRFDVVRGLDDVTLSDWEKSSQISAHTSNYLSEVNVERALKRCARMLIQGNSRFGCLSLEEMKGYHYYVTQACKLWQNLPPQVYLKDPIVLHDALEGYFVFHIEWISSLEAFIDIMERETRKQLEERYKEGGSAKIRNGEFLLQDVSGNRKFDLLRQPWSLVMKPGTRRNMSITFRETGVVQQSCPHCSCENELVEGEPTVCKNEECEATYERVIEVEQEILEHEPIEQIAMETVPALGSYRAKRKRVAEPDLRLAFRRLILMSTVVQQVARPRECMATEGQKECTASPPINDSAAVQIAESFDGLLRERECESGQHTCSLTGCEGVFESSETMLRHVGQCSGLSNGLYRCFDCGADEQIERYHFNGCHENRCIDRLAAVLNSHRRRSSGSRRDNESPIEMEPEVERKRKTPGSLASEYDIFQHLTSPDSQENIRKRPRRAAPPSMSPTSKARECNLRESPVPEDRTAEGQLPPVIQYAPAPKTTMGSGGPPYLDEGEYHLFPIPYSPSTSSSVHPRSAYPTHFGESLVIRSDSHYSNAISDIEFITSRTLPRPFQSSWNVFDFPPLFGTDWPNWDEKAKLYDYKNAHNGQELLPMPDGMGNEEWVDIATEADGGMSAALNLGQPGELSVSIERNSLDEREEAATVPIDRWAQIRKNAAERAAMHKGEQTHDDSDEETIETRVARIKARIAELTGTIIDPRHPLELLSLGPHLKKVALQTTVVTNSTY